MADSLDCPHCGGDAITSENGLFSDGDGEACDSCGLPGCVSVDDSDEDDVTAHWHCSEDPERRCDQADCDECREPALTGGAK